MSESNVDGFKSAIHTNQTEMYFNSWRWTITVGTKEGQELQLQVYLDCFFSYKIEE